MTQSRPPARPRRPGPFPFPGLPSFPFQFAAIAALASTLLASCSSLPVSRDQTIPISSIPESDRAVVASVLKGMQNEDIKGLSFVLVDGRGPSIKYGLGYADVRRKTPATPGTLFGGGSTTKLFTAIAIMQLAEEGRINLDAPLSLYLKDFAIRSRFPDGRPITIRSILTHHSGLPSDYFFNWSSGLNPPAPGSVTMESLPLLLHEEYVAYPPDTAFSYSNLGFALLGLVIERESGMTAAEYFRRRIFEPIGMKHSLLALTPGDRVGMAKGDFNGRSVDLPYIRDVTAGMILSTADDMERFIRCMLDGGAPILKPASLREMFRVQNEGVVKDGPFRIGLTFWRFDLFKGNHPAYGHGGDIDPFHAFLILLPEDHLGMALYSNSGRSGSLSLGGIAASTLAENARLQRLKSDGTASSDTENERTDGHTTDARADFDASCEGEYVSWMGPARIQLSGRSVYMRFNGIPLKLQSLPDGWSAPRLDLFHLASIHLDALDSIRVRCAAGEKGRSLWLKFKAFSVVAFPLEYTPVASVWLNRTGLYRNADEEPFKMIEAMRLTLDEKSGVLVDEVQLGYAGGGKKMPVYMKTVSDADLVAQGYGRNLGETVHFMIWKGRPTLVFHGSHFQKMD